MSYEWSNMYVYECVCECISVYACEYENYGIVLKHQFNELWSCGMVDLIEHFHVLPIA